MALKDNRIKHKLQALVYDILPSRRKVPESDARSVTHTLTHTGTLSKVFGMEKQRSVVYAAAIWRGPVQDHVGMAIWLSKLYLY